jgi:intracellular septation protein
LMNKSIIKSMLGKELKADDAIWARVTWYWALFFMVCGLGNIYIAFSLPLETWVNFKVFGLTALTLINTVVTVFYLFKHSQADQDGPAN